MMRMKALARMYVWWPGLETNIEESVRLCDKCQLNESSPSTQPMKLANKTLGRTHLDYAGPFKSHYVLVLIDAHSK